MAMKLAIPVSPYPNPPRYAFPRKLEKGQTNRYASFSLTADLRVGFFWVDFTKPNRRYIGIPRFRSAL